MNYETFGIVEEADMWNTLIKQFRQLQDIVAYLPHARTVEPQKEAFLSNTRINNCTAGLCKPLLGNGSVNTLPRRRSDITLQQYLAIT
jgi:hypothetical protein